MASVIRKPPGVREPSSSSPASSPSRTARPTSIAPSTTTSSSSPTRNRSMRSSNPVTARAAATQRRESPLASVTGGRDSSTDLDAEEAARAGTMATLDDLRQRLVAAETAADDFQRRATKLQSKLDETSREHELVEEKCHEQEEQMEALRNEGREATRRIREMESIYEAERGAMVKEKESMANREEEMQTVIQRLNDRLAQRQSNEDDARPARLMNGSPILESSNFAPPTSLQRSDSRNNSKLILQKDRVIEQLRLEVAEAQIKLVESENSGGSHVHEVERQLMEARMTIARLMEDNESYQLLLQEKTLAGDFGKTDFSYMGASHTNEDALAALEGKPSTGGVGSLADELNDAADHDAESFKRLETELRSQERENKALTLYINKIIERLLQQPNFEHILDQASDPKSSDINKDLPAPPKEVASGPSLLQRAKSMALGSGGPGGRARPRPMSMIPPPSGNTTTSHSNPSTAPSIPIGLGRTQSTRRSRPQSEQFNSAASVVNQMYKGGLDGSIISPGLRNSQQYFLPAQRERIGSSNSVQTTSPLGSSLTGIKSETSSISGDDSVSATTVSGDAGTISSTSPPASHHQSSPTRNTSGQHREFKESTSFAGNKPRPLRLVQESNDAAAAAAANKRQSWLPGWFAGAAALKDAGGSAGTSPSIRE